MSTTNIKPNGFAKQEFKLSDAKALEFVQIFEQAVQEDIKANSNEYKSIVKEDLLKLEMNLKGEIKDTKLDTIKWMVGVFFALALMIMGLYIKK